MTGREHAGEDERAGSSARPHDHHHHRPSPDGIGRAFAAAMALNLAFVVAEVVAGIAAASTALLADAAHNLGDVLGLALAWGAGALARRARSPRRTYGFRRSTIVAAFGNAMLILVAIGGVGWEAIHRLGSAHAVNGGIVALVAAAGVLINGAAALLFARDRRSDLNVRAVFLHLAVDAAVSAGVVVSGVVVWQTGWSWVDPAASLAVAAVVLVGTWQLLREAMNLLLDAVPAWIDPEAVEAYLRGVPSVTAVHDIHIWSLSTTEIALTAHLVVEWDECAPSLAHEVAHGIEERFHIGHATIQLEPADHPEPCARDGSHVV